ncbi:MAG: AraC family transcriptional regulator, partial [Lachnospiraceae bacterium]|nr:AraC family transcriptional regulator [Lachnospiraceae bacterium]
MITEQKFETNENRMELFPKDSSVLPCICKYVDLKKYVGNRVPWHWHKFSEINFIIQGTGIVHVSDREYEIKQGEALFISSNTLHSFDVSEKGEYPLYYTIFFEDEFLTGGVNSIFSQKYFLPVTTCHELQSYPIRPENSEGIRMLNSLINIIDLFKEEPFGYEFSIRTALSDFWLMFFRITEDIRKESGHFTAVEEGRIKQMLKYIEDNYREKVLLDDIADAAGISSRECGRVFSETVRMSPIEYLNRYRIRVAAGRLAESDDPISIIAEECGFLSDSYFS